MRFGLSIAAAAGVAVLVGGGWSLARAPTRGEVPDPASPKSAAAEGQPPPLVGRPARASKEAETAASTEEAAPQHEDGASGYPSAPTDGPVRVIVTYAGTGAPPQMMEIAAVPEGGDGVSLRLAAGTLEGRLPASKEYRLSFVIDGWGSDQVTRVPVPADQTLRLEVVLPGVPTLRVLDSSTEEPIPSARALAVPWEDEGRAIPRPETLGGTSISADAGGRLTLTKTARSQNLWIGAAGHSWTRVEVAPEDRERRILLGRSGGLLVYVEGVTDWSRLGVLATPAGKKPVASNDAAAAEDEWDPSQVFLAPTDVPGRYLVEGMPPGRWRVRVGWRGRWDLQESLHSSETDVRVGETTELRVRVAASAPDWHTVLLELIVPKEWGSARNIQVSGVGDKTSGVLPYGEPPFVEGPPGTWRVRLEKVPAGPYQVRVRELGFSRLLRVGTGTTSARIAVPPPVSLQIRVLDEQSGKPVPDAVVTGGSSSPFDDGAGFEESAGADPPGSEGRVTSWGGVASMATRDEKTGDLSLRVPAGQVVVRVTAPGYLDTEVPVAVAPGTTDLEREIRVTRGGTIVVRVVRDGHVVVTNAAGDYVLDAVEVVGWEPEMNDKGIRSGGFEGGTMRLDGLIPGKYRVRLQLIGIEKEVVGEIEVRAGEQKTVDLDLPAK